METIRSNNTMLVIFFSAGLLGYGNIWASTSKWILKVSPTGSAGIAKCAKEEMPRCISGLTLVRALDMVGNMDWLKLEQDKGKQIRIDISAGIYRIQSPLKINWGRNTNTRSLLTISGPDSGKAIISGAQLIKRFEVVKFNPDVRLPAVAKGNVYKAKLSNFPGLDLRPPVERGFNRPVVPVTAEIFFNRQVLPVAQWPNKGSGKIIVMTPIDAFAGVSHYVAIKGRKVTDWVNEPNLIAAGYFGVDWAEELIPVQSIDAKKNVLVLSGSVPQFGIKQGQRIRILDAISELDMPGEWYIDRKSSTLYLWPPKPISDGDVEISLLDNLLQIDGARNVRFTNLVFEMARGNAILVKNSENVEIDHSTIRNVANRAVIFSGGKNSGLNHVLIEHVGEGGVVLEGGSRITLEPGNLYVDYCQIRQFSRLSSTYRPAIVVSGVGNRVIGNILSDAPHSAIIFYGNDHMIAYNDISRVVQEADDAGAIYAGRDWTNRGTEIINNFLHDIGAKKIGHARTMGIYLDDQTSGITIRGNVFARVPHPIFIGGGRDNVVEHNLIFDSSPAIHLDARGLGWQKAMTLDKNGTLQRTLNMVPYNRPPYSDRYKHLSNIREDEVGKPKYNLARCNQVVRGILFDIEKEANSGILIENNFNLEESIFIKQMQASYRKEIEDFQLNQTEFSPNKECISTIIQNISGINRVLRLTKQSIPTP